VDESESCELTLNLTEQFQSKSEDSIASHFSSPRFTEPELVISSKSFSLSSETDLTISEMFGGAKGKLQRKTSFGYFIGIIVLVTVGTSFALYSLVLENRLIWEELRHFRRQRIECDQLLDENEPLKKLSLENTIVEPEETFTKTDKDNSSGTFDVFMIDSQ
jgi:hypothetical protein